MKSKSKKRKSDVLEQVEEPNVEEAQVKTKKEKKDKNDKKDKKEKKGKEGKMDNSTTAQGDRIENDNARALIPPSNTASTSTITPLETEGKKRKKEKKSKSTQVNETESSTPKVKKQKKSKPPLPLPTPGPSNPMGGSDELSSDEADIFEIDELLPSSPVLPSPPPLPSQNQIISQPTPTPKPRRTRVSDSSGFDTPSAPDHLRHPHALSNITGSGDTPSRLGRIGGTPIKKALVRLGASWVTSTPAPK